MRLPKTAACLLTIAAACFAFSASPRTAQAEGFDAFTKTYKVQVEYWFFDTDYYYWSTVLETNSLSEAQFLYNVLAAAKADNQLNAYAPNSYWRYIAVDVRMTTEYHYPQFTSARKYNLKPISGARSYSIR